MNLLFSILLVISASSAKTLKQDHVDVRLISPTANFTGDFKLGVHFKLEGHWHIYWKNPGDSGAAPKFQFTGAELKKISWPYPVRLPVESFTNYGYEKEVVIGLDVRSTGSPIKINLEWLVCKVECVPGFAEFEIIPENVDVDAALFQKYQILVPKAEELGPVSFVSLDDTFLKFDFRLTKEKLSQIKNIFVFPENGKDFLTTLPATEPLEDRLRISVPLSNNAGALGASQDFTFVVHDQNGSVDSFSHAIPSQKTPPSLWWGLVLAFIGGMILNLMPCVFPVLFLKLFSFLKEENRAAIRKSSWHYTYGVIATFLTVGALLSLLRFSGEAIGWGYQLQNPWVVYLLALLFFAMGLNFYGFFEMGNSLTLFSSKLSKNNFFSGSFGTGVLAVIVASPCTAPFMGSALGLAILLPAHLSILIFLSLGAGMALPMLVLAYLPQWIEKLPRSGQWMIVVKQLMSFPLFAAALWLLWVLGNQKGTDGIFFALVSFLVFVLGLWILNVTKKKRWSVFAMLLIFGAPALAIYQLRYLSLPVAGASEKSWAAYDEKVLNEKRTTQPVFIDFTAAWCITCQVNKKTVLHTDEIQELFKNQNVFLMQADWTNQDPLITKALARFDRNSVPLYVYYGKNVEPKVLPEILTKDIIKNLFTQGE